MTSTEHVEKVRQAIMRYRELLDLLHTSVANAEKNYAALFDSVTQEQKESLPEKLLQREAALIAIENMEPLRRAALNMQFRMRDFERGFEDIYNNIAPEDSPE